MPPFVKLSVVLPSMLFCSFLFAQNQKNDHGHDDLSLYSQLPEYFRGEKEISDEYEGTQYAITFLSNQGRNAVAREKQLYLEEHHQNLDVPRVEKSVAEKNYYYFKIKAALPENTNFRISGAFNNSEGDTEVSIEIEKILTDQDKELLQSTLGALSIKENHYGFLQEVHTIPPTITEEQLANWNFSTGYKKISSLFSSGFSLVSVTIVFDREDYDPEAQEIAYSNPVIDYLFDTQAGISAQDIGLNEQYIWWTQEITLEQLDHLIKSPLVINLIPHENAEWKFYN